MVVIRLMGAIACEAVLGADLEVGVSTVMLRTSSSASLRRPCLTGLVTTTYLHPQHAMSDMQSSSSKGHLSTIFVDLHELSMLCKLHSQVQLLKGQGQEVLHLMWHAVSKIQATDRHTDECAPELAPILCSHPLL